MSWIRVVPSRLLIGVCLIFACLWPSLAETPRVAPTTRDGALTSYAPIVKLVAPSVVNVYATRKVASQASPLFNDPFFQRFFGDGNLQGMPRERVESSLGSGVIIDKSGIIVTNFHVIANATDVRIALSDKREFDATIMLKDEKTDLAILKIKGGEGDFPVAELGDSDDLQVGDVVLAIGNPFGVGQTVTHGIVSALARTQVGVSDYRFFIQTDAAINPGNSGGALVDLNGKLVGIPSEIYSQSGGSIGIGFAIPAAMVKFIAAQAKNGGVVKRPWLGASLQAVTPDLAESMGLKVPTGALVAAVTPNGPAAKAGLKVGDVVTGIDGIATDDPDAFGYRFSTKPLGTTTDVSVERGGAKLSVTLALASAPEVPARDERAITGESPFAGLTVDNLSPAVAEELGAATGAEGVIVKSVDSGSVAERLGFRRGDLVLSVNGAKVADTKTLARIAASNPGVWRLAVGRDGQVLRMALQ
jgi:Do/DeqQ family serine protease